jgi:AcrR family transcriptional regulator
MTKAKKAVPAKSARKRDSTSTRGAILDAAQRLFSMYGYPHVGVREIAAEVGVTAPLVNRYFGSKEQLFAEVLSRSFGVSSLAGLEPAQFALRVVEHISSKKENVHQEKGDPLLIVLRSSGSAEAVQLLRRAIEERSIDPLADRLPGTNARMRAGAMIACIMGLALVRQVLRSSALIDCDPADLVTVCRGMLQACVDAPAQHATSGREDDGMAARPKGRARQRNV